MVKHRQCITLTQQRFRAGNHNGIESFSVTLKFADAFRDVECD